MSDASIDPGLFRQVLGSYPTGVCAITALDAGGKPAGMQRQAPPPATTPTSFAIKDMAKNEIFDAVTSHRASPSQACADVDPVGDRDVRFLAQFVGAALVVMSYSSLAVVLLTATLALQVISVDVALGLVLGANLGSGLLAVLTTLRANVATRQVPLGNLCFKLLGVGLAIFLINPWLALVKPYVSQPAVLTVLFHLSFNLMVAVIFIGLTQTVAGWVERLLPNVSSTPLGRPNHLDPSALATPSLAISCAAREAMHQADMVETMLRGVITVLKAGDAFDLNHRLLQQHQ